MKIQELAIIFIIIILPISLVLAEYTQFQIKTLNTQSVYDAKLTSATYDAIKAFQLNAQNETYSDIANLRMENIEASVNAFRNSIMTTFKLNGYTEEQLDNYIPALVYTLYDGFYLYSPYNNMNHRYEDPESTTGESTSIIEPEVTDVKSEGNGENLYGLKPYINYSCRYVATGIDVVITYALDNYVTVQGTINGEYYNKSGYLIDNIIVSGEVDTNADGIIDEYNIKYNGVDIEEEQLYENVGGTRYPYFKNNGIKYYLVGNQIVFISNGQLKVQFAEEYDPTMFGKWKNMIENNNFAKQYYKDAAVFTDWFKTSGLDKLTYNDAIDEVIDDEGNIELTNIWNGDTRVIFDFNTSPNINNNIENELSSFNQHRLAIIRHKIETNLAIAISNYNTYSGAANVFQMPELKEDEWDQITHNIALISFLQGLSIGGKVYNGYTLVTNSESKEVVLENNIYILGNDKQYHRIGDNTLIVDNSGTYGHKRSAGRLNLDFKRTTIANNDNIEIYYYYPLKEYNASYNSIVMQNNVTTYDDIYAYVGTKDLDLQKAFYTALGRERAGKYNTNIIVDTGNMQAGSASGEELAKYMIVYDANGGENAPSAQLKDHGKPITLRSEIPNRSGYIFKGWDINSNATTPSFLAGSTYTNDSNVTLYAIWGTSTVTTHTITYNANGGTGGPGTQVVTGGGTSLELVQPTRDGYRFIGWKAEDGTLYSPGDIFTVTGDTTLYAEWEEETIPVTTYTITYNANGGSVTPSAQTVTAGSEVTLPTPIRDGYNFTGWSTPTGETYNAGTNYTVNEDVTLSAGWEIISTPVIPVTTYTITYNANGGYNAPSAQTVTAGESIVLSTQKPYKFGFGQTTFLGWSTDSSSTTAQYSSGQTIIPTGNMTLYAVWGSGSGSSTDTTTTYTITYKAGTMSYGVTVPDPVTVEAGKSVTLPTLETTMGYYTFKGWSTSSSYGATVDYEAGAEFTPTADITLYAVWKYSFGM